MNIELLKQLTQIDGPSGEEEAICKYIKKTIKPYVDSVKVDAMGNLIAHIKGDGKKVMAVAHMDEIGVIATYIDDNGFIRFGAVGGLYTKELNHRRVRFTRSGAEGVIALEEKEDKPSITKMYIDIGAKTKAEAEERVSIGDTASFVGDFATSGNRVISKALDNRAGCYVLIEAIKKLKKTNNDVYAVFSTQEEVGLRGARTSAFSIMPDMAIAVDVTDVGDTPNCQANNLKLGDGAAIKVSDASVMCHYEVRESLIALAKKNKIPYALEVLTAGGTDAGIVHLTGSGVRTGGVSIPTRYIHSPSEMADMGDIDACVDLVSAFLAKEI